MFMFMYTVNLFLLLLLKNTQISCQQEDDFEDLDTNKVTWCTISEAEQKKCQAWSQAVSLASNEFEIGLECRKATDKDECMNLIDSERADLVSLDAGELFVAGHYHSLIPIMAERYGPGQEKGYYSVAVVNVTTAAQLRTLEDLKGKKACFSGVGQLAGWVAPMSVLIDKQILDVIDCNNLVKSVSQFFGNSCAPNSLIDKFNPTGDNPHKMCLLCGGQRGNLCSGADIYANFEGAFKCLVEHGEISFLKHTTVDEITREPWYRGPSRSQFRLVCPSGATTEIDNYRSCNWGFVPAHVIATTSATTPANKFKFQRFLKLSVEKFGGPAPNLDLLYPEQDLAANFRLFQSGRLYNDEMNLLFLDVSTALIPLLEVQQTVMGYLRDSQDYIKKLQRCPVPPARLCVASDIEMRKCHQMATAFRAQMLKPDLSCIRGYTNIHCMRFIQEGSADLTMLDVADVYTAGNKFHLIPILAEQYNLKEPSYYVVAVAQQPDKETDLLYLKGRTSCHTGIGMAAGWVIPMSFLIKNERMRSFGCDSAQAAAQFFQKSCVPGAMSKEYTSGESSLSNLCDLCHSASYSFCSRDPSETYFGNTGALQCLVEGGGQIAFVKHTTIMENTAGKNQAFWSRPMMPTDFELLCRDGTRAKHDQYEACNLGKVASNAMVTHGNKPESIVQAYVNLFLYAQQFYGSKYSEQFTFKMFVSEEKFKDVIFQDATQQLKEVPSEKRNYREYVGYEFIQDMKIVDCTAASNSLCSSLVTVVLVAAISRCL